VVPRPGARGGGRGQRRDERRLHLAEDLGAEAEAVGELLQAQRLQVGGERGHHAQQQLGQVLRLDLDVRLLGGRGREGRVRTRGQRWQPHRWESCADDVQDRTLKTVIDVDSTYHHHTHLDTQRSKLCLLFRYKFKCILKKVFIISCFIYIFWIITTIKTQNVPRCVTHISFKRVIKKCVYNTVLCYASKST